MQTPPLADKSKFCYNRMMIRCKTTLLHWGNLTLLFLLNPLSVAAQPQVRDGVSLIQPLNDALNASLPSSSSIFLDYFNMSVGWLFRVAVGFTVMWVLIGGVMFLTSGNNQGRRSEAISRMTWSITGLIILLFAGVILRTLNSLFFTP
jgi:hypothetical protein